jgi:predicted ferric reductase
VPSTHRRAAALSPAAGVVVALALKGHPRLGVYVCAAVSLLASVLGTGSGPSALCWDYHTWFSIGAGLIIVLFAELHSRGAALLRPGGALASLHFTQFGSSGFLDHFALYSVAELIFVALFYGWLAVSFAFYYEQIVVFELNTARAIGKALGQVAVRLIWVTLVTPLRNSAVLHIFGCPLERAVKYHRQAGRFAVTTFVAHAICMFVGYDDRQPMKMGTPLDTAKNGNVLYGVIALFFWLAFTATAVAKVRRQYFEYFYFNHLSLLGPCQIFTVLHARPAYFPWVLGAIVFLYFDFALRWVLKFKTPAALLKLELVAPDVVRLEIGRPEGHAGPLVPAAMSWEAGSYLWLGISGEGIMQHSAHAAGQPKGLPPLLPPPVIPLPSWTMFHPITISNAPGSATFVVHIKALHRGDGQWADLLCDAAAAKTDPASVKVRVGGPNGRATIHHEDYPTLVLCAGGIGVTPALATIADCIARAAQMPTVKRVVLLWAVRSAELVAAFQPEFDAIKAANDAAGAKIDFDVRLFFTGTAAIQVVPNKKLDAALEADQAKAQQQQQQRGEAGQHPAVRSTEYGRPDFSDALSKLQADTQKAGDRFMGVMSCGPESLMKAVQRGVSRCNASGGVTVHLHQETFEL